VNYKLEVITTSARGQNRTLILLNQKGVPTNQPRVGGGGDFTSHSEFYFYSQSSLKSMPKFRSDVNKTGDTFTFEDVEGDVCHLIRVLRFKPFHRACIMSFVSNYMTVMAWVGRRFVS
jgi:hypothetical protein